MILGISITFAIAVIGYLHNLRSLANRQLEVSARQYEIMRDLLKQLPPREKAA